jgi:hypothetical protein
MLTNLAATLATEIDFDQTPVELVLGEGRTIVVRDEATLRAQLASLAKDAWELVSIRHHDDGNLVSLEFRRTPS